jgi:hypothetical protein
METNLHKKTYIDLVAISAMQTLLAHDLAKSFVYQQGYVWVAKQAYLIGEAMYNEAYNVPPVSVD